MAVPGDGEEDLGCIEAVIDHVCKEGGGCMSHEIVCIYFFHLLCYFGRTISDTKTGHHI